MKYTEDLNYCELEMLKEHLMDNHREFRSLYNYHSEEISQEIDKLLQKNQQNQQVNAEPVMKEVAELAQK